MALASTIKLDVNATHTSALDLSTVIDPVAYSLTLSLATGTGANQADLIFHDTRTLAASATEDLDLVATLVDAFGATLTFARVKALIVTAASGNTNNVQVTRVATSGTSIFLADGDGLSVRPGGMFVIAATDATGYVVTATSDDTITFTNSAGSTSVTYSVIIIGCSA